MERIDQVFQLLELMRGRKFEMNGQLISLLKVLFKDHAEIVQFSMTSPTSACGCFALSKQEEMIRIPFEVQYKTNPNGRVELGF